MAEAIVLYGGIVKQNTKLSKVEFVRIAGYVASFELNEKRYIHCIKSDFKSGDRGSKYFSAGYYIKTKFLEYLADQMDIQSLSAEKLKETDIPAAVKGDQVIVQKLRTKSPYNDFCKVDRYTWDFLPGENILDNAGENIVVPSRALKADPPIDIPVNSVARSFYNRSILLVTSSDFIGDKDTGAYLIASIALQIHRINTVIFPLFGSDDDFTNYISSQNLEWSLENVFVKPNLNDFRDYLSYLTEFFNTIFSNQVNLQKVSTETKLYWLTYILSENSLKIVPVYDKVSVLSFVAQGTILGKTSNYIFGVVDEEALVIKIASSITKTQSTGFLLGLTNSIFFQEKKSTFGNKKISKFTLFQLLYEKVDDEGVGNENLKILMDKLYFIWVQSDYYPYNLNNTVKDSEVNSIIYADKPIDLAYETGTVAYIFEGSNYDFVFDSYQIIVYKLRDIRIEQYFDVVGKYKIFQPITIKNTDSNTNRTKFLTVNVEGNNKAILPIFYLKYIDDKKESNNLFTAAELTFDIALTLSGIGNIRHIRHVWKLGRVALGLETATGGEILMRYELAQGLAGAIEVSSSLADIFIIYVSNYKDTYCDISSPSYNKELCDQYTTLDNIFIIMQLGGGALDFASSMLLKKSARSFLTGEIPDGFSEDILSILRKFAGDFSEIKEVFRARLVNLYGNDSFIWSKLNEFDLAKQEEFLLDFERAQDDVLNLLNTSENELMVYWEQVTDLKYERTKIGYLESFKDVKKNLDLIKHVQEGDSKLIYAFEKDGVTRKPTGASVSGYHNFDKVVPPPPGSGQISFVGTFKNSNPLSPDKGYIQGKILRNMLDKTDEATGLPWKIFNSNPPIHVKVKKAENVFWPKSYNADRINEEMAYALNNMDPKTKKLTSIDPLGKRTFVYQSRASDGHGVEIMYFDGVIVSIYPKYF